jgi:hypothetical protein
MSDAQIRIKELYAEVKDAESKKKDLNQVIKDAYAGHSEYKEITEKMAGLRVRKKEIEAVMRSQYSTEFNDLDDVKLDLKDMKVVLSDLMWNELMKNHSVEVMDEYDNRYVPHVMVTLKKERN